VFISKMNKNRKKKIERFRNALRVFALLKLDYRICRGDFDCMIDKFLRGDTLRITTNIDLQPNDIIFMSALAGGSIDRKTVKRVRNLWREEKP
jgi:hypothetical protein